MREENPRRRRRVLIIAVSTLAACAIYNCYNMSGGGVDYDHFVPPNRFLFAEGGGVFSGKRGILAGPRASITLKRRSKENAAALRNSQRRAARARAGKSEEGDLTLDVLLSVTATMNGRHAFEIPDNRRAPVKIYDVDSALLAARAFNREVLFFVYDSATDDFVVLHNLPICEGGCKRAYIIAPVLAYALRNNYPERFQGGQSGDLVMMLSGGDMPRVRRPCLFADSKYCKSDSWAPILQFGSVLSDPIYMPSVIAMPPSPRPHIPCFDEFQTTGNVCRDLQPQKMDVDSNPENQDANQYLKTGVHANQYLNIGQHFQHGLVFGREFGLLEGPNYWNDLIPQVIWRGTDFTYLHILFPDMRSPTYAGDVAPVEGKFSDQVRSAIADLWELGEDILTPRWRGVLLTSEAELEAREASAEVLPWVDIKFTSCNVDGKKLRANLNPEFQLLQEKAGITAIGRPISMAEHANYRYHIDLGGGGGTTWTGTIEKLALPGLLFHHVTPTKDWFHDHLEPWVHYVPVSANLNDFREMYDWAESHPQEAQRIAEAGTDFARWMGSREGFQQLYQEHMVAPLGRIITAYKQPRKRHKGQRVLDILRESTFNGVKDEFGVVARCGGWPADSSKCRWSSEKDKEENDLANGVEATD